jgi:signal transduction histidine kinase
MMLSVQHLEKAWKEHAPDWDQRLLRFTENMTEQIESLSAIATEFSDFAKMPQTQNEKLELKEVIGNVVSLYRDNIPIIIRLKHGEEPYPVVADRKQILRVFTNLINNSVQAIGNEKGGEITITMERQNDIIQIHVKDNGSGMSKDQARRIFQPNFTTKSGGTGLGLAIVKSIVLGAGGEITFETEEGLGTVFTVRFPVVKD